MPEIKTYTSQELTQKYDPYLIQLIESLRPKTVCDIGGGRNPRLPLDFVRRHEIDYTVLDISQEELDRGPAEYAKQFADVGSIDFVAEQKFDFVFSRMVAEHIKSGQQFHTNIFRMLKPGGVAFHFFPTLFALPFVVNWMIPEWVSDPLLSLVGSRDREKSGKFPAYYSWTFGPTTKQIARLESIGYEVVFSAAAFGHVYYRRLPIVRNVAKKFTERLLVRPDYRFCSYAYMVLRRPTETGEPLRTSSFPYP